MDKFGLPAAALFFAFALVAVSPVQAQDKPAQPLTVERIKPTGEDVPPSRQIVIEFNRPVVPLGRMERSTAETGVTITPPLNCQWRWLNRSSLACNLDEKDALKAATRYHISIAPLIRAEDGALIDAPVAHDFTTLRPKANSASFSTWLAPSRPVLRVLFNQPVSQNTVEAHLYFTSGKTRFVLEAAPDTNAQKLPDYVYVPGEKQWIPTGGGERRSDDDKMSIGGEEARRVWLVKPRDALPESADASLTVEAGLASALGEERGIQTGPIIGFDTFGPFAFAGVRCRSMENDDILIAPEKAAGLKCNPLEPVALAFTAPVLRSNVKKFAAFKPDLAGGRSDYNPWGEEDRDNPALGEPYTKGRLYYVGLPVGLKAARVYTLSLPGQAQGLKDRLKAMLTDAPAIKDEFGRTLASSVFMQFATAHRNPNFEMPYRDLVLESGVDSDLPLYVNNLTGFGFRYRAVSPSGVRVNQSFTRSVRKIDDVQYAVPGGVRAMLQGKPGALYATLSTMPAVPNKWSGEYRLFAQISPWQMHVKLGHFSSIAWLIDLASGTPVEGARVRVFKGSFTQLGAPADVLAEGISDAQGLVSLPGAALLDPEQALASQYDDAKPRLFVRAERGQDMALLPLDNDFALDTWNFSQDNTWSSTRNRYGHLKSWGFTAQGIYRAGDTMQYKFFVRDQNDRTLVPPPAGRYTLEISDPMGKSVERVETVALSPFGAYAGEFKIPLTAAVGWYNFKLRADFTNGKTKEKTNPQGGDEGEDDRPGVVTLYPMRVLVSDFTPSPFRVATETGGDAFRPGDIMAIESRATLHSGGAYGDAALRLTITLKKGAFTSLDPRSRDFTFGAGEEGHDSAQLYQKESTLNAQGVWSTPFTVPQQPIYAGKIEVESAVSDDRGKSVAALAYADYKGVDRFVGLKSPAWFYETKKPVTLLSVSVDEKGAPQAGVPESITIEREEISVAKVKGAGNAYQNDVTRAWVKAAACDGVSAAEPRPCVFTPAAAGSYRARARITDTKGRAHETDISFWVSGDDYVQWNDQDNLALSLTPEKKDYKVGETARFLIKNPWPGANALVSIERYGVIERFTQKLEGSAPVLSIPVKPDYMPGFYLSVVVVSPRVAAPPAQPGQIDMGKPAFRMGYAGVVVRDTYKDIAIDVKPAQDVYRPRDTVALRIHAAPRHADGAAQPIELAVAVLDESVFDLIAQGRRAFDPYEGFYDLDGLDMRNYSLLARLIGRQAFEKKGASAGGDGGADMAMRTLFKYVSYWNPSLEVDADGNADIQFAAPDNLTGWRVLAVAATPTDRMGLGEGGFKVNRPTELRPAMPNMVHEGDTFMAGFSVMNRTDRARTLAVRIEATGNAAYEGTSALKDETVTLEPFKRTTVYLPLRAAFLPLVRETGTGGIVLRARAGDETDVDSMEYALPVLKKRTVNVAADYGTATQARTSVSVAIPAGIYTDAGEAGVTLSPSVLANLGGAFAYLRDYPYECWEQLLTRAVMAANHTRLKPWLPAANTWEGAERLPAETLARAADFQAPDGGMAYFVPTDAHADPYLSAYTALAFNWIRRAGYTVPADMEARLHTYLLAFLRSDAAPDFYDQGMKSSVRAVALAALADARKIGPDDVLRYAPHMKEMSLFGKAQFLQAALTFDAGRKAAKETADSILAAGNETSGKFIFSETLDDGYARMLATPLRDNCAILSALGAYAAKDPAAPLADQTFKLVRTITQSRGSRDHWENTQENVFCMQALADYAQANENVRPAMTVTAALDGSALGKANFASVQDAPVTLKKPLGPDDAGKKRTLELVREGEGRFYYVTRLRYALKDEAGAAVNAGMEVEREYAVRRAGKWVILKPGEAVSRGENVRVDLYLSLPGARNFVVVDDPLPGGLETVNRDLATASSVDAAAAQYDAQGGSLWFRHDDWREYGLSFWSFYHRELRHDSARFFADRLDAGNYHLSYMTQAIAQGRFAAPPVLAREMYDDDVYGRGSDGFLEIKAP